MAMRDNSGIVPVAALEPQVYTADANGDTVDLLGFDSCVLSWHVGITGDTLSGSVYLELEVEESDDNSTWTDCANADLTSTVTGNNTGTIAKIDAAAEDDAIYYASYIGNARYVRCVLNVTGTHTNGIEVSAQAIKGHARNAT